MAAITSAAPVKYWHLILYIDADQTPQHVTIDRPLAFAELVEMVEETASVAVESISYWDPEVHAYLALESLDPIIKRKGRAQLWIQSDGMRLEPVHKTVDELEFRELRQHAHTLNTEHVSFHLVEAHRVTFPRLEKLFHARLRELLDPDAPTALLFYTGNSNTSSDAVQNGFALPKGGGGVVFTTSLADHSQTSPPAHPQKVLLCEVAIGRVGSPSTVTSPETGATTRVFDASSADSLVAFKGSSRTYTVFHPYQAIPRYVLTVKGVAAGGPVTGISSRRSTPSRAHGDGSGARLSTPPLTPTNHQSAPSGRAGSSGGGGGAASASLYCPAHKEELSSLWCSTCQSLVCAYCLSVGQHRGHDGREMDEVLGKFRTSLNEAAVQFSERHEGAKRLQELQNSTRRELEERKRQGAESLRSAVEEARAALLARQQELLDDLASKGTQSDPQVESLNAYVAKCQAYKKRIDAMLTTAQGATKASKMEFLRQAPQFLNELLAQPFPKVPSATTLPVAAVATYVDMRPVFAAVKKLHFQSNPVRHQVATSPTSHALSEPIFGGNDAMAPGEGGSAVATLQKQHLQRKAQLDDLCAGYIWVIPQAEKHFHPDQRKDIFSDVFFVRGVAWELRIASEVVPSADGPQGGTQTGDTSTAAGAADGDSLSVYLHSVNHRHRMDYRVILFAPGEWHAKEARGWTTEFAGKGWGVRPYIPRRMLSRTFVHDGVVKVCLVPTSDLY